MPIITAGIADPVEVSGLDAVPSSRITADIADPVQVFGLPAVILTPEPPEPTITPAPDTARARVLDAAGAFICHLPHAQGLRWMDEFNSAGSGSIDVRRYDEVEDRNPNVWDPGNQVMISVGALDVFRLVLDAEGGYQLTDATAERSDTRTGLGALGILNSGMLEPEYGWRPEATMERSFDYGSNPAIGGWYVPAEWKTPVGIRVRKSWRWTHRKRHRPKGWPERRAKWIWWKNPDSTSIPDETCYFRSSFAIGSAGRYKFWVCGDDTLQFQVDGEIRATVGPGGWARATTIVLHLSAGTHFIASRVVNAPASTGNKNRAGFICAVGKLNSDGDVVKWVRRSNTTNWVVRRQRSGPPGWFPAQALRRLVFEQQARGCAGHAPITFGFTPTVDSSKSAWTKRKDFSITVGTLGLEYTQRLIEAGIDVAMSTNLVLNAWRKRGADRSRTVKLNQKDGNPAAESAPQPPPRRNVLWARAKTGWVGRSDTTSIAADGRRETFVTLGSSRSRTRTANALESMLPDLADPPQTVDVVLSGVVGPQPYAKFNVGDWVSYRPAGATTWIRHRVMSISGEVTDTNHPLWTVQLYEDVA